MNKKKTILVLADHPMAPSGVGTQTKYVITALLKTGRYKFICMGGAVKHQNYEPQTITGEDWDEGDWVVHPVDGYGTADMIRSIIWTEKIDALWFMTDPRFYEWLWSVENEIRSIVPMIYYHVWDNYPVPKYNAKWYRSTDVIASISKVTYDIVNKAAPSVENHYLPHAVDGDIFKKVSKEETQKFIDENFPDYDEGKFYIFWNNRNARRKHAGTLINCFNKFAEEIGRDKVCLIMHTDPNDPQGQDLTNLLHDLKIQPGTVVLSTNKLPPQGLAFLYNTSDCTINISDAEGFGLSTLESLSCGTPIIVNMTGGLQEQVTDGEEWFGIGMDPAAKALIGSQQVPYIYEDRLSEEQIINAMKEMYNLSKKEREEMGRKGSEYVQKNYNFKDFEQKWIDLMDDILERYGSWDTRKGYKSWEIAEIG